MENRSVRLMIFDTNRKILLIRRVEIESREPSKLILPGGRVNNHESDSQALKREIDEELGITIVESDIYILGREVKSSYDELVITFYAYNQPIQLKSIKINSEEVANVKYYDLHAIDKDRIAFNEYNIYMKYSKQAVVSDPKPLPNRF